MIDNQGEVLLDMQTRVFAVNVANGWNQGERSPLEDAMLLVTEVAEMAEAYRDGLMADHVSYGGERVLRGSSLHQEWLEQGVAPKPEGFGSECADVLIRLLDTCERYGIDLSAQFERKLAHNITRGYRHGGKVA